MNSRQSGYVEILLPLPSKAAELAQLEWLVDLMDSRFAIPGTKYRLGLDALLGLVPGVGDAVSTLISIYVFRCLRKYDLPWHLQARLLGNILLDFGLGVVPLVGDLFDIAFKANSANVSLVKNHLNKNVSPLR